MRKRGHGLDVYPVQGLTLLDILCLRRGLVFPLLFWLRQRFELKPTALD